MAIVELIHKRVGNDLQIVVQLFDNETPIDWTTVKRIFPVLYSDSQRVRMGMCRVLGVDPQDHTVLRLSYSGKQPQYKGVARLVIELNYMESTCTVDCPALVFVEATADEGVGPVEVEIDTNVDPEINSLRIVIGGGGSATWGNIGGDIEDQTDLMNALAAKQDTIADLQSIREGAAAGATAYQKPSGGIPGTDLDAGVRTKLNKADSAVQPGDLALVASTGDYDDLIDKPSLATVATSGSYNDLTNKPTIPAAQVNSDWNADTGVAKILNKPSLATVATTGSYDDLTNKPTIPPEVVVDQTYDPTSANAQSGVAVAGALADKQDVIADLATIEAGAAAGATAVQPGDLATVATSGLYSDLTGTPTIPAAPGTLNTDNTGAQAVSSSEALSGTVKLHKVSKTGSYADLLNKPTIPAAQVNSDWNAASGVAQILNKPTLATVATSGSYTDLSNKPTIDATPTSASTNAVQSGGVYTELVARPKYYLCADEAEYQAIATKQSDTLYLIPES